MAEDDWVITKPIDHTKIGAAPQKIRDVKSATKIIIAKEHVTPATDNAGGQHLKGSARVYLSDAVATLDPEGNSLDTAATSDDGRIHVNTSASNELRVYVGTAAGVSTGWEHVRVGRVKASEDLNANSKNISNIASGTLTGHAIHVGQINTDYLKLNEPATGADLRVHIDTSFIATAHASGLTVRLASLNSSVMTSAVVLNDMAAQVAGVLSAYTNKDSGGNVMLKSHAYKAVTAGFVSAHATLTSASHTINGYVGATNDPAGAGDKIASQGMSADVDVPKTVFFAVAKDEYFEIISSSGTPTIRWKSFGTLGKPIDQD